MSSFFSTIIINIMAQAQKARPRGDRVGAKSAPSKQLLRKAIDIKGKKYVLVSDRIIFFNENFPNGSIQTQIVDLNNESVLIKAVVTPDSDQPERFFVGHAQETFGQGVVNQTSAIENAETSAIGRALAMMGIGVIDSIASVDEINKANNTNARDKDPQSRASQVFKQKALISILLRDLDRQVTRENVKDVIRELVDLELTEENFEEIIKRLRVLRDEKMEAFQ